MCLSAAVCCLYICVDHLVYTYFSRMEPAFCRGLLFFIDALVFFLFAAQQKHYWHFTIDLADDDIE